MRSISKYDVCLIAALLSAVMAQLFPGSANLYGLGAVLSGVAAIAFFFCDSIFVSVRLKDLDTSAVVPRAVLPPHDQLIHSGATSAPTPQRPTEVATPQDRETFVDFYSIMVAGTRSKKDHQAKIPQTARLSAMAKSFASETFVETSYVTVGAVTLTILEDASQFHIAPKAKHTQELKLQPRVDDMLQDVVGTRAALH